MPRFDPDFTKVDASIPIHDKGLYELKVTKVTPFAYIKEEDNAEVAGVRLSMEVVGVLDSKGKLNRDSAGRQVVPQRLYVHTEKAWGMAKQTAMAIAGYARDDEDNANEKFFAKNEFFVDGLDDDVTCGSGWLTLDGRHVRVYLDKGMDTYEGRTREVQNFQNWMPAKAK